MGYGKFGIQIGFSLVLLTLLTTACNPHGLWPAQSQATLAAMTVIDPANVCRVDYAPAAASTFFVLLGAGLLTGLSHCIGMCGPLVSVFSMRRRAAGQDSSTPLAIFQLGRLTTYLLLGVLFGSAGSLITVAVRDWQSIVSVALGLLMILVGLGLLGLVPLQRWLAALGLARLVTAGLKRWLASNHPAAPFGLGLANGLLPCGPVYAMAILAAVSGDPVKGASVMLIFGLGTLPAMLGLGFAATHLGLRLRSHLYRIAAFLVIIVGLQLTLRGLAVSGQVSHAAIGNVMLW